MSTLYRYGDPKKGVFRLGWYCHPGCPAHPTGAAYHCVSLRTKDRKTAERLQAAKERALAHEGASLILGLHAPTVAVDMTLAAFVDWYLDKVERERIVARSTIKASEGPALRKLLEFAPKAQLTELTEDFVRRYQATVRHRYSDYTWNSRRATLRSIFARAVTWKLLGHNPFGVLDRATPQQKRPKRMQQEDLPRILRHTNGLFWKLVILFLYATGCRLNELCKLERAHVRRAQGYVEFETPKEGRPKLVALTPALEQIITRAERLSTSRYVFSLDGGPLKRESVKSAFDRIAKRAGLPFSAHRLRHSHGSHVKEAGGNLKDIQVTLGHADLRTTADFYLDVDLPAQRRSMGLLPIETLMETACSTSMGQAQTTDIFDFII